MNSEWYLVFFIDDNTFTVTIILVTFISIIINIIIVNLYTLYNYLGLTQFEQRLPFYTNFDLGLFLSLFKALAKRSYLNSYIKI